MQCLRNGKGLVFRFSCVHTIRFKNPSRKNIKSIHEGNKSCNRWELNSVRAFCFKSHSLSGFPWLLPPERDCELPVCVCVRCVFVLGTSIVISNCANDRMINPLRMNKTFDYCAQSQLIHQTMYLVYCAVLAMCPEPFKVAHASWPHKGAFRHHMKRVTAQNTPTVMPFPTPTK